MADRAEVAGGDSDDSSRPDGPSRPADSLRRCWLPVGLTSELDTRATKAVRVLGEDLVLFRDKSGTVGLLVERCAHEGAMLSTGWVERRGLVCPSHRWIFDAAGNCFIVPGAPPGSPCHPTVRQTAYPVQENNGLYWAYLGPLPAPPLPLLDAKPLQIVQSRAMAHWLTVLEREQEGGERDTQVPNLVCQAGSTRIYVAIDDTQTAIYMLEFEPRMGAAPW